MTNQYHEPFELISDEVKDITRAINSLKEELEAVDWYNQRADLATNSELKSILEHNRNEEMEHAVMIMEWLRRNMDGWDKEMQNYLFKTSPITNLESGAVQKDDPKETVSLGTSLNIGNMK